MINFFNFIANNSQSIIRDIRSTGTTFTISGTSNNLNILSVPYFGLYAPVCWYDTGRTYFAHRKSHVGGNLGTAGIIQYYNGNVTNQFMPSNPASLDYHDNPALITDGAGTIYIFHEQHNLNKSEVWTNTTPYDITTFAYQQLSPEIGDYPKLFKIDANNYFIIGRTSPYNLSITPYDGTTFGTPVLASVPDAEGSNYRHYPFGLINGFMTDDGYFNLKFNKRLFVTEEFYTKYYHVRIKPDDIYTWYNVDESYSRKLNTEGHLTESILDANYQYVVNTVSGYGGGGMGIVNNGVIYQMNRIDSVSSLYKYDSGWTNRTNADIQGKSATFMIGNGKIYSIERTGNDLNLYETNLNDVYILKEKLITSSTGINQVSIPHNFNEIPSGSKFAIFVGGYKNSDGDVVTGTEENDIYIIEMIK